MEGRLAQTHDTEQELQRKIIDAQSALLKAVQGQPAARPVKHPQSTTDDDDDEDSLGGDDGDHAARARRAVASRSTSSSDQQDKNFALNQSDNCRSLLSYPLLRIYSL